MGRANGMQDAARVIVGIDPGLANTGFGVVSIERTKLRPVWYGTVSTTPDQNASERLVTIHDACVQVLERFKPESVAVETLFFGASAPAALSVGQVRGVCILAAAAAEIPAFDYAPAQVKQAVTGFGRADKRQVQEMVQALLGLTELPRPDHAADALAVAVCHSARPAHRPPSKEQHGDLATARSTRRGTRR